MSTRIYRKDGFYKIESDVPSASGATTFTEAPYSAQVYFDGTSINFIDPIVGTIQVTYTDITQPSGYSSGYTLAAELNSWETDLSRTVFTQENGAQTIVASNYTISDDDYIIHLNGTGSNVINLPELKVAGRTLVIKDSGQNCATNTCTLQVSNIEIDGATSFVMNQDGQCVQLFGKVDDTGVAWFIQSSDAGGGGGSTVPNGTVNGSILRWDGTGTAWVQESGIIVLDNLEVTKDNVTFNITTPGVFSVVAQAPTLNSFISAQTSGVTLHAQQSNDVSNIDMVNDVITIDNYDLTYTSQSRFRKDGTTFSNSNGTYSSVMFSNIVDLSIYTEDVNDGTITSQLYMPNSGSGYVSLSKVTNGASSGVDQESLIQLDNQDEAIKLYTAITEAATTRADIFEIKLGADAAFGARMRSKTENGGVIHQDNELILHSDPTTDDGFELKSAIDVAGVNYTHNIKSYAKITTMNAKDTSSANDGNQIVLAANENSTIWNGTADCNAVTIGVSQTYINTGIVNSVGIGGSAIPMNESNTVYTGGGRIIKSKTITDNYTVTEADHYIIFNTGVGKTITLPSAPEGGRIYIITNNDAVQNVDLDGNSNGFGVGGPTTYTLGASLSVHLIFDSLYWNFL